MWGRNNGLCPQPRHLRCTTGPANQRLDGSWGWPLYQAPGKTDWKWGGQAAGRSRNEKGKTFPGELRLGLGGVEGESQPGNEMGKARDPSEQPSSSGWVVSAKA